MDHQICWFQAFRCHSDDNINRILATDFYISNFITWWNKILNQIPVQYICY